MCILIVLVPPIMHLISPRLLFVSYLLITHHSYHKYTSDRRRGLPNKYQLTHWNKDEEESYRT